MDKVFDVLPPAMQKRLRRRPQPPWIEPMLATLTDRPFSSPGWLFERKLDGVRCLIFRNGASLKIMSRNRKDMTGGYPELAEAMSRQPALDFIVDGEIVAFEGSHTSFARLQARLGLRDPQRARATGVEVFLYLFDVLHLLGRDTRDLPLLERKKLLEAAVRFKDPVRYCEPIVGTGRDALAGACRDGWEGLIAKRMDSVYQPCLSRAWLKLKCVNEQEVIILGYTDPQGSRTGLGALLVGYHENGGLRYAGKVGTGYNERTLRDLREHLEQLELPQAPVRPPPAVNNAHWVRPQIVAQIGFSQWTRDGRLRHPRFLGLRSDKPARAVTRERPEPPR
jgi:bifunctional non-homologous end joining protein LigD